MVMFCFTRATLILPFSWAVQLSASRAMLQWYFKKCEMESDCALSQQTNFHVDYTTLFNCPTMNKSWPAASKVCRKIASFYSL